METSFKILFTAAVAVFCASVVGVFLLIIKISLLFTPQINFLGLSISKALY